MDQKIRVLKNSALFRGLDETEIEGLLQSLGGRVRSYDKGNFVIYAGDEVHSLGIVLYGSVHIMQEDYWGNRNILASVPAGGMFAEAFASLPGSCSAVDVMVVEKSEILFIDLRHVLGGRTTLTESQKTLAANLLAVLAGKNLVLTEKIRYMSQRSTRQKLMAYLSHEARKRGKDTFSIEFNRQQLADFLSVDRSAMSAELGRMKRDGLIDYNKESFTLLHG
ncbi:Crp/Fnr family transcriptional regulator [Megasphaera sp. AM44-1BH]|jgi:CRP-like cAMP-binding protein|uniref:Crp/Fnr family transcriptional regulator n=1 Tax=Megasphaera sp. AM44-1BH TaxID=2292358 RepID=UPI000E4E194E|nr:Crp/Fnr family transcriptional regulator [Megasphaera sp. AM44-1BH]RHA15775.1 Crp/Fnr family transcriptional regulator [Megasphaera sp. AM44-1BH]